MDTDTVSIKTDDIYKYIAKDVEIIFDTSNYKLDRWLPKEKKSNQINERWIAWKNHDKICFIKTKILQLVKITKQNP